MKDSPEQIEAKATFHKAVQAFCDAYPNPEYPGSPVVTHWVLECHTERFEEPVMDEEGDTCTEYFSGQSEGLSRTMWRGLVEIARDRARSY
jgi:hypothetical protein